MKALPLVLLVALSTPALAAGASDTQPNPATKDAPADNGVVWDANRTQLPPGKDSVDPRIDEKLLPSNAPKPADEKPLGTG